MSELLTIKKKEYPVIRKKLWLKEYDKSFARDYVEVWLNWSREFQTRLDEHRASLQNIGQVITTAARVALLDELVKTGVTLFDDDDLGVRPEDLVEWVNRGAAIYDQLAEKVTEAESEAAFEAWTEDSFALYAECWGCTEEEARKIYEVDVDLWNWINARAAQMRQEFRERRKKAD